MMRFIDNALAPRPTAFDAGSDTESDAGEKSE